MGKVYIGKNPIEFADEIALQSQDRSSRAGCFIVNTNLKNSDRLISIGYNKLSKGFDVNDDKNHERPFKYKIFLHAEINAITSAAKMGVSILGATMYLNWFPCSNCALAIVNSGISELHCDEEPDWTSNDHWIEDQALALDILKRGDVKIVYDNYKVKNRIVNDNK